MSAAFPDRCPVCDCNLRERQVSFQSPSGSEGHDSEPGRQQAGMSEPTRQRARSHVPTFPRSHALPSPSGSERAGDHVGDAGPSLQRCPDCGFTYDEHTRIWQSTESWALLALRYAIVGLVLGLIISLLYRLSFDEAPYPMLPLALGLVAPAVGLAIRRMISGRLTGRFVALTPLGIVVATRPRPTIIPWSDFDRVTDQRGVLKLQRRGDPTLIPLDDIFTSPAEAATFRQTLSDTARQHRRPPDQPPQPS